MANVLDKKRRFVAPGEPLVRLLLSLDSVPGSITVSEEGQIKLDLEGSLVE